MKEVVNTLTKHKWVLFTMICFVILLFAVSLIRFTHLTDMNDAVIHLSYWIKAHKYPFIVWHILIIAAIYVFWGLKVDQVVKRNQLSQCDAKKIKPFRYWMMAFVVIVNLWVHWY